MAISRNVFFVEFLCGGMACAPSPTCCSEGINDSSRILRSGQQAGGRPHLNRQGGNGWARTSGGATEMYLSHAEGGMKSAYARRDWKRLERALKKMGKMLETVVNQSETAADSPTDIA